MTWADEWAALAEEAKRLIKRDYGDCWELAPKSREPDCASCRMVEAFETLREAAETARSVVEAEES